MSIDIRDLQPNRQPVGQKPAADALQSGVSGRGAGAERAGGRGDGDQVALSPEARRLQSLQAASASTPDVDMAKVERIRLEIAEGRYPIDADQLAGRMLELERNLAG
jgi:negative regulator of flagellin synthesis FlgM